MDVQLWVEREQFLDGQQTEREKFNLHAKGHWNEKEGSLAFAETDQEGTKSWVLIEWKCGGIRIERRGELMMVLPLAPPGEPVVPGHLRWSGGELLIGANVQELSVETDPHSALLVFRYALFSEKQELGVFFHQYSAVSSIPAYGEMPDADGASAC